MTTLVQGSRGKAVKEFQTKAVKLGFGKFLGKHGIDSVYGEDSETTCRELQKWLKINVDGKAGKVTERNMDKAILQAGYRGTLNFNINSFRCKGTWKMLAGGMDSELITKLEQLRYALGNRPVIINSGYRTPAHNKKVGGVPNSQHLYGKAADIVVHGVNPSNVYNVAHGLFSNGGVGSYNTFTHVDTRGYRARF